MLDELDSLDYFVHESIRMSVDEEMPVYPDEEYQHVCYVCIFPPCIWIANWNYKCIVSDSQKIQELQMHLDKVRNELNNNNTQGQKIHLQGAQMMTASMHEGNNSTMTNHTGVTNHTG